jgi:hypothetical protein
MDSMGTPMLASAKRSEGAGADALGRRIRRAQLRVFRLQGLQLAEQPVVLGVGDLRVVEDVVAVVVVVQLDAQLLGARARRPSTLFTAPVRPSRLACRAAAPAPGRAQLAGVRVTQGSRRAAHIAIEQLGR